MNPSIIFALASMLCAGIVLFLLLAVKTGEAIIVVPMAQLSFIITGILSIRFLKAKITFLKIVGIAFAVGTILCLSFSGS